MMFVNMAETAEECPTSSENETSGLSGSMESIDFSCIHWGYLNCMCLNDPKKFKDNIWQTYWVDLCGSTLRLYRDLSLPENSGERLPPSNLVGPKNENEKKEAFIILKKGTEVSIVEPGSEPYKSRKTRFSVNRKYVFRVSFGSRGTNTPSYLFQAPSVGSMYRWISKIEEGVDMADKPQNESATDKRLKEAKLLSMEQRRLNIASKHRYLDKDDIDSGMEGDVEEAYENSKKFAENPHVDILKKRLQHMQDLVQQLEKQEEAFLGTQDASLVRRCEFQSRTNKDYCLVPGHPRTLIPKGTELTILGQFSNNRWRCFVELPRKTSTRLTNGQNSGSSSEVESISSFDTTEDESRADKVILIGSVPNSLLVELNNSAASKLKFEDGTPVASPGDTPQLSPLPTPPLSPYSPHKNEHELLPNKRSSLRRSIASENLSEQDIWEQFCIPPPPTLPVTSRSTSLSSSSSSHSLSCSLGGSLEDLDVDNTVSNENASPEESGNYPEVALRQREGGGRNELNFRSHREAILMDDDIPETYIGSESEDDRMVTVIDEVPPHEHLEFENFEQEPVKMRDKKERSKRDADSESLGGLQPNYAFLVTKKLRQRGISLIVGSSSSEDEGDDDKGHPTKLTRRRLDAEFSQFEAEGTEQGIRPHSAFVPTKRAGITLGTGVQNFVPRKSTKDELLRDYSSPLEKPPTIRPNTCPSIETLGDWSSTENAPPINQRRTLQLSKDAAAGFGFTLQTYGIVQEEGQVEYMTFVLSVEEDGPAYMAGLRPGDIILEVDGTNVEEEDHKLVVTRIHEASEAVRLVVVFVDALRKMKMNTRLKLLQAKLAEKEHLFEELSKKEEEIIKGKGVDSFDVSLLDDKSSSYLYTTEITSSFSKKSPNVHDSLFQYRQPVQDKVDRPRSLPEQAELGKQRVSLTTGSEILQKFSSPDLSAQRSKPSNKLLKSFRKKKPSEESSKFYVEIDLDDRNSGKDEETGSEHSASSVFEQAVTAAEPTSVSRTTLEARTSEQERPASNNWKTFNGKPNSVLRGDEQNNSTALRGSSENPGLSNGSRVAPGVAEMRRRLEKSSSKSLPQKSAKPTRDQPRGSTLDSNALHRPDLQNAGMSPRPASYLLAMDSARNRPLVPKEKKK